MSETTALSDGGLLTFDPAFLDRASADTLFAELRRDVPWKQEAGRGRPFPRLTAWFADAGLDYRYSGVVHRGEGWTPTLHDLRRRVESASSAEFNSVLLNLYRDGRDSI